MAKEPRVYWKNESLQQMLLGKLGRLLQKNESRLLLSHTNIKFNSKLIKDLAVWLETIKDREEITGKTFHNIDFSDVFGSSTPITRKAKAKIR